MYPSYLDAYENGGLKKSAETAFGMLKSCAICPRRCKVNRLNDECGACKTGLKARVYSYQAHHGEEPPISATNGSGTIFFSGCNMSCVYCQNYEFSQSKRGRETEPEELSNIMLGLQGMGCHNINLVSPTHIMPQILKALELAIPKGLKIPLVYNTGGYELTDSIKLLEGIVDIYLPDMRYADDNSSLKYSLAPDYPGYNRQAVREMHRQVGRAKIDKEGVIRKGLIIRHLVLPAAIAGTEKIIEFIAKEISADTYISLMSQYMPLYKAGEFKEISRRITRKEYEEAKSAMSEYGLYNGWSQEGCGLDSFAGINIKSTYQNKDGHIPICN